jgi:D-alanyl-D-alanine carboxypeptidase
MDAGTGTVLWANDPDGKYFPASTTKILTALIVAERSSPSDIFTTPLEPLQNVQGSSLHLQPGETLSSEDLIHALMMRSANDACAVVALQISGSIEAFAELMNQRAKQAGATNSSFRNPHGLHDPLHYSTARDLAIIAREALKNERVARASKGQRYPLTSRSLNQRDTLLVSRNDLLSKDPTMIGIKTGFTNPAGRCFVGAHTRDGMTLITVILNSLDWRADQVALSQWALNSFELRTTVPAGTVVAEAEVRDGKQDSVALVTTLEDRHVVPKGWQPTTLELKEPVTLTAPISQNKEVGFLRYTLFDGSTVEIPVKTQNSVSALEWYERINLGAVATTLLTLVLGGAAFLLRRRAQRIATEIG